jgi:ankyrin repeat protein
MARNEYTKEVAPFMNLCNATRECKHLQAIMMNVKFGSSKSPQLHMFIKNRCKKRIEFLLKFRGIDVNSKDRFLQTPLHLAIQHFPEFAHKLIDKGADLHAINSNGWTILYVASLFGETDIVHRLLLSGADVNICSEGGISPIQNAACNGFVEILDLLVKKGADLESRDKKGRRPLHCASEFGHLQNRFKVIRKLVQVYHVDINARMNDGRTALGLNREKNNSKIVAFLLANGAID